MKLLERLKSKGFEIFLFLAFFIFSYFLMWKTFRQDPEGNIKIATKAWSDFAATIPLIRSFSMGSNFPPQYPLFAGPPIRYHFVFFAFVGFLEKIGLPLDWALNTLSSISFFLLLLSNYLLGKEVFKSKSIGLLTVILFLFNGSFSFLQFFKKYPLSLDTLSQIIKNTQFSSFGPYDGKVVSAFWSLNIFTNQRHLALAYASFIFLTLWIYKLAKNPQKMTWKKILIAGIIIGLFPFIHLAVFGMMGMALVVFILIYKKLRLQIFTIGVTALLLAIPQLIFMGNSEIDIRFFNPGYLVRNLNLENFLSYWFLNLGISVVLLPIGLILAKKSQRKIFLPFLALFIVGNLFQFSPEIAANHKFFNLFLIGANMYVALTLWNLWKKKVYGKVITLILLFFVTFSGIIDFFPIVNDNFVTIQDFPNNPAVAFIEKETPRNSVFLNSSYLYHPASLAGRKIFFGWPYFSWSAGYDTNKRGKEFREIYSSQNKEEFCVRTKRHGIDYFAIEDTKGNTDLPNIDIKFFEQNFVSSYKDNRIIIFETGKNCR